MKRAKNLQGIKSLLNILFCLFATTLTFAEEISIGLPYYEKGFYLSQYPKAYSYFFILPSGQSLSIEFKSSKNLSLRLYEVGSNHRVKEKISFPYKGNIEALTQERYFVVEIKGNSNQQDFILKINGNPILPFPVAGKTSQDIISLAGDLRDNGIRRHEGIDIKADKRTKLYSVSEAIVTEVSKSPKGGKFAMLKDTSRPLLYYYYAHCDSLSVKEGTKIHKGAIVGKVGDTGNSQPGDFHLHFGIYDLRFQFLNPLYFVTYIPYPDVLDFEKVYTFPFPYETSVVLNKQKLSFDEKQEKSFPLKKGTPLVMLSNTSEGTKAILNEKVVFLHLKDLSDYALKFLEN